MEKPILFNTPMTQAILDGRKSRTSRPIKHMSEAMQNEPADMIAFIEEPQYQVGDILWVRETWQYIDFAGEDNGYVYKASQNGMDWEQNSDGWAWRPSIHMPREAARIFLKATKVKVQRIQDITEDEAKAEGCITFEDKIGNGKLKDVANFDLTAKEAFKNLWDSIYALPQPVKEHGIITHYESYPWENVQETREYKGLPWIVHGNPWCWAYEFERRKNGKVS